MRALASLLSSPPARPSPRPPRPPSPAPRRFSPIAGAALLLAALVLAGAAATAPAAPPAMSASPTAVAPGGSVQIRYAVKRLPAKLVLRLDRKQLKTVRVRRGRARGRTTITVPRDVAPGNRKLTGCVERACRSVTLRVGGRAPAPRPGESLPPGSGAGPAAEPKPLPPVDFSGPPNPLHVQAHADPSRRTIATIGFAGGTLATTGADGTRYTLTVPQGALLSEERISMTPIASVDGLPFAGGLAAGVQLEPSGLRFADFVTLEIDGHPAVSPQEETGFLYQRDGAEFQLYPIDQDPTRTRFQLMHFSGVGVARGTEAERNAQLLRATTDVEGRLIQQLGAIIRRGEAVDHAAVQATMRAYHDQVLKPLVVAALTDDGLAIEAINRYLGWEQMNQHIMGDEFMAAERRELAAQWIAIIQNAAIKAHRRCVDENRPEELPIVLSWWRQLGMMGIEMPTELWAAISGCARFELDFHTKIRQEQPFNPEGPTIWKGEAIAENVILEPDPLTLQQRGTKEAQYLDFEVEIPPHEPGTGCWFGGGEWESTFPFTVSRLEMDLNPIQRPDGSYGYPQLERGQIKLAVIPFAVQEYIYAVDCGGGTGSGGWSMWLAPIFRNLHEEKLDETGNIVFTDWTVPTGGGSLLGAKTFFRTQVLGGFKTSEETTLELYHAPTG